MLLVRSSDVSRVSLAANRLISSAMAHGTATCGSLSRVFDTHRSTRLQSACAVSALSGATSGVGANG